MLSKCYNFDKIFGTDLEDTTLALDFRVTVLEETGGDDGNSSVAELEVRVETLEGTAADHEKRISALATNISGTTSLLPSIATFVIRYQELYFNYTVFNCFQIWKELLLTMKQD